MGDRSERAMVGRRAGEEGIYRTAEASNTGGSESAVLTTEGREELESRGLNPDWDVRQFRKSLKEEAQKNGVWLNNDYLSDKTLTHDQRTHGTTENDVYVNPDGKTVTKGFQIITEQPYIREGSRKITQPEIDDYLQKMGFEKNASLGIEGRYKNDQTLLHDVNPDNVILTPDGNIAVIDPIMMLNTPDWKYGGKRKFKNKVEEIDSKEDEHHSSGETQCEEVGAGQKTGMLRSWFPG